MTLLQTLFNLQHQFLCGFGPALLTKVLIFESPLVSWRCLPLLSRGFGDLLRAWPLSFSSARDLKPSHVKQPFANLHWPQHVSRRMAHHFASFHWLKVWRSRSGSCAWSIEQLSRSLAEMSSET